MKELLFTLIFAASVVFIPFAQNKEYVSSLISKSWKQSRTSLDSAELIIEDAISIAKTRKYDKELASGLCYRGIYYDMQGESDKALALFVRAIKIQKRIGDDQGLGFTFTNLGLLHYAQYDYDTAIKYLNKSLRIRKKLNDPAGEAGCYSNLAIFYLNKEDPVRALEYNQKAGEIYRELKDSSGLISVLSTRGRIYFDEGNSVKALDNFLEVKSILSASPSKYFGRITNLISIGIAYESLGKLDSAKSELLEALDLALILGNPEREQFCYEALQKVSVSQEDYKSAYEYLERFSQLKNQLLTEEKTKSINELQVKYDVAEKDKRIIENRKKQSILIIGSISLMVIILFLIYVYFLKRKLATSLVMRNDTMRENLDQKEVMMLEIHHRVKNNLQLVSSILSLKANSLSDPKSVKALLDSQEKIFSMAQLHRFLYEKENLDSVNLKNYIEGLVEELAFALKVEDQDFFYDLDLCTISQVTMDTAVSVGLVINELVNNVFKHSARDTEEIEFKISLSNDGQDRLELQIQDKGVGSSDSKESLIQRSFGLKMVDSLVRQLNGSWKIFNQNGMKHVINFQYK